MQAIPTPRSSWPLVTLSGGIRTLCSWCETLIAAGGGEPAPRINYGMCADCLARELRALERRDTPNAA